MINFSEMRSKLLTLDQVNERLATTEPMHPVPFTVGPGIKFFAESGWNHGLRAKEGNEVVPVYAQVGVGKNVTEFRLTKETVQEAALTFGMSRQYTTDCPAELLVPHLNYWFREGLASQPRKKLDYQFITNDGVATAFSKQGITPFSNLGLLRQITDSIREQFNTDDILADYKFSHTLRQTHVRLIVPAESFALEGTGTPDDQWSLGIQMRNSLTGTSPTTLEGYLFRWACTNGQIDAGARLGHFTRRKDSTQAEVYEWARQAVDDVFKGLETAQGNLHEMSRMSVEGNLADVLRDIFEHYRIPLQHRAKIIRIVEEHDGEITMYVIMNAITQVANEAGLEPSAVDSLLRVGGDLPYTTNGRCGADNPCGRLIHSH